MAEKKVKLLTSDATYCLGCKGCELACGTRKASKYNSHEKDSRRMVTPNIIVIQSSDQKIPSYCRHCDDAFCLKLCPTKAITRENKIVILDNHKCTGCGICEQGCPYGVITMTSYTKDSIVKKVANKCDMCIDRQLEGMEPLCYSACPTKALRLL